MKMVYYFSFGRGRSAGGGGSLLPGEQTSTPVLTARSRQAPNAGTESKALREAFNHPHGY